MFTKPIPKGTLAVGVFASAALAVTASSVWAADHLDSETVVGEPTADLTDLFAWTSEGGDKTNLVLNVMPNAGDNAAFSTATQYAFHLSSMDGYGAETEVSETLLCQFYKADGIECWLGDEYVEGDPSDPAGIESASGKMKVFAGLRNDPFFLEFSGLQTAVGTVVANAGILAFDAAGCPDTRVDAPDVDPPESVASVLGKQLRGSGDPQDFFAGHNVLSLVVQLDTDLVNAGGDTLAVWSSSHRVDASGDDDSDAEENMNDENSAEGDAQ